MKKFIKRRLFVFLFPFIAICITVGALIFSNNDDQKQELVVKVEKEQTYRKVYMLDDDNYLVPLTFAFDSKELLADDIRYVISMLRDESILTEKGYHTVLNKDAKIQAIDLDNNILNIDFSKEFKDMDVSSEEKVVESLVWTLTQYDEVNGVTISVDGVKLETLPLSNITLPTVLDKSIGINKYHDTTGNIYNTTSVTVFYEKENYGEKVYVPITRRVVKENDEKLTIYNAIFKDIATLTGLKQISEIDLIDQSISVDFNDEEPIVALQTKALIDEGVVDESIYELLIMTYNDLNDMNVSFSFEVNEEEVSVNGYKDSEEFNVSSIIINEIKV